jgi:hypothetical protein
MPIIYLKMLYHLFKATRIYNFLWIGPLWILFGAILLPCYVVKDLMYFIKINCDDGDKTMDDSERFSEEHKMRKLDIYNTMYKVLKSTYM